MVWNRPEAIAFKISWCISSDTFGSSEAPNSTLLSDGVRRGFIGLPLPICARRHIKKGGRHGLRQAEAFAFAFELVGETHWRWMFSTAALETTI